MTMSIDDILGESGTSKKDVEEALEALQNANADLKEVIDMFGDYAVNMTDAIAALAEAQIGDLENWHSYLISAFCWGLNNNSLVSDFTLTFEEGW